MNANYTEDTRTPICTTISEICTHISELELDVERLQNENQQILEQRQEHDELVRAVDQQQTLAERRAGAGVATRAK